ncbi:MAG: S-methyl-5-thioribose-1-phosphate isomerase [Dehalococcoidia bacterium]|nr:S-methyl-5-thioribose-1-phosphate isomerase [Dehalococcoidia bacterium]
MTEVVPLRIVPGESIHLLDQVQLPHEERYLRIATVDALCEAIAALRVRGAPLLGLAGACGMAIAATERGTTDDALRLAATTIAATRPTAVDLPAAVTAALEFALALPEPEREAALWAYAGEYAARRVREDRALAAYGAPLLPAGAAVLTHCNAGALSTGGIGTALGVIRAAWEQGTLAHCYATETRPLLQGARLTAWELARLGIPATLLPDTAAASLLATGRVHAVITGADRIAANGDSANKIGTFQLALAAARHGVPLYIAAPLTTVDFDCPGGATIPIEFRDEREVGGFGATRWAPEGLAAYNPAFDVTPDDLIAAIITERGVARPPLGSALAALRGGATVA